MAATPPDRVTSGSDEPYDSSALLLSNRNNKIIEINRGMQNNDIGPILIDDEQKSAANKMNALYADKNDE